MEFFLKVFTTLFFEEILVFFPLIFLFFYSIFIFRVNKNYNLFLKILIFLLPFLYIFYMYSYLPDYFSSLGQDSLLEAKDPDLGEAIFFLKNFFISLFDPEIFKRNRFWLVLLSSLIASSITYYALSIFCKKKKIDIIYYSKFFSYFFLFIIIIVFISLFNLADKSLKAGKKLKDLENKFTENSLNYSSIKKEDDGLLVTTLIGESTAALNLSVYGYPFNNTPWMNSKAKDKKTLIFNKVFATATHTTPSLVDALSLCTENCSDVNLINQKHVAITELVKKSKIRTTLYSTQGNLGGHNLASKLVLNTDQKFFPFSREGEGLLGNRFVPKIKDNEFFLESYCKNSKIYKSTKSNLVYLHSYAGHGLYGGYSRHIEEKVKFKYPNYINKKNFLGKDFSNFNLTQEYDTAINYIDKTLENAVKCNFLNAKIHNKPAIFIYFADHGESPGSRRGHDSSRLTYEMLHVPFMIFFNEKAYDLHQDKFDYLKNLRDKNASLKIVKDTILFLFNIDVQSNRTKKIVYDFDSFESLKTKYLLKRELLNKKKVKTPTFWNKNLSILKDIDDETLANQDTSISLWQLNNYLQSNQLTDRKKIKNLVCQHRANSFILQFKASLSIGCFETDIYYFKDKVLSAHDENKTEDINLIFKDFFNSNYQNNTVWMDSKNIDKTKNCKYALRWFKNNGDKLKNILVELPTASIKSINNQEWLNCIDQISNIKNIEIGYYLDTGLLTKCSQDIKKNMKKKTNCENLYSKTFKVLDSMKIQSITFDHQVGYKAVQNNDQLKKMKWHTWHVDSIEEFNKLIKRDNTGIILLQNDKNLNNLN